MIVKNCKLEKVATCSEGDTIVAVAKKLKAGRQRHAIVLKNKSPAGIISAVDIVNKVVAMGKDAKKVKASAVMNKVKCIDCNESVLRAYFAMAKSNFVSCPVIENKNYIGNLTMHEAVRYISKKDAQTR